MTKGERATRVAELVEMMRGCERFFEQDVFNRYVPSSTSEVRELRQDLWEAKEVLRVCDGVDFAPLEGWPSGTFGRAPAKQIVGRAERQRARGTRAHRRAAERFRLAATLVPDEERERLESAADRIVLREAMRRARS